MVCAAETEDCFNEKCIHCPKEHLMSILMNRNDIDLDDDCSWTIWKKVNNKFDLQQMTGSVDSLVTEIKERWSAFLLHAYSNRQQRDYIKDL